MKEAQSSWAPKCFKDKSSQHFRSFKFDREEALALDDKNATAVDDDAVVTVHARDGESAYELGLGRGPFVPAHVFEILSLTRPKGEEVLKGFNTLRIAFHELELVAFNLDSEEAAGAFLPIRIIELERVDKPERSADVGEPPLLQVDDADRVIELRADDAVWLADSGGDEGDLEP